MSRHRERLAPHFRFALPDSDVVELSIDKRRQYEAASRLGVAHPPTLYPEHPGDLGNGLPGLRFPAFVKPYHSHLWQRVFPGRKGVLVRDAGELEHALREVDGLGLRVAVQTVIKGPASNLFGFRFYLDGSRRVLAKMVNRKLRQDDPEFGSASYIESAKCEETETTSLRFLRGIGYAGLGTVELKRDEQDGHLYLIELNGRLWLSNWLATSCGMNFPLVYYLDVTGQPPAPTLDYPTGVRYLHLRGDRQSLRTLRRRGDLTLPRWLASLARATVFAHFYWRDPAPFFATTPLGSHLRRARSRLAGLVTRLQRKLLVVPASVATITDGWAVPLSPPI